MGFFSKLATWRRTPRAAALRRRWNADPRRVRACTFESMEPRQLLAAHPIVLGAVYVEEDIGSDLHGDRFEIQFTGGAPGTQLRRLIFNADRGAAGLDRGDLIFDTIEAGLGADHAIGFQVDQLISNNPQARVTAHVQDGDSRLVLEFQGFAAGDKLVFSIDVDEVEYFSPGETNLDRINQGLDPITSGVEFQGTELVAEFVAPHFLDADATALFWNLYDEQLRQSGLDLPVDNVDGKRDRTAGAFLDLQQAVNPAAISGYVYADANNNGRRDAAERGLAGITLHVIPVSTLVEQSTVTVVTDAQGFYAVSQLSPGTYRIVELQQPAGYLDGLDAAGTVGGVVTGRAVNPGDQIEDIFLGGGAQGIEYNFGELLPASIAGYVHLSDADGNCCTGTVCQPIADVMIKLLDRSGSVIAQTTTDTSGRYSFQDLLPGQYAVVEVTPAGLIDGAALAGTVNGVLRGRVLDPNTIVDIQLNPGDQGTEFDFCEHPPSVLSGHVFHDRNNNGRRDTGEEAIAGTTVSLYDQSGAVRGVAQTDATGRYEFTFLAAGIYRLVETQPAGWLDGQDAVGRVDGVPTGTLASNDTINAIRLRWGSTGVEYDFGELLPASLAGLVHTDDNGNCLLDAGERPIAGVRIELLDAGGRTVGTTTTDAAGRYRFSDVTPGTYTVREPQPVGYFQGGQRAGSHGGDASVADLISQIPVGSGDTLTDYDFCEIVPASLAGLVFADLNENARWDTGETLLAGVTVELLDAAGQVVATTRTSAAGTYEFTLLRPGVYGVHERQPAGYFHGGQTAGSHGGVDDVADLITAVAIPPGTALTQYNFYELPPASISGFVFQDGPAVQLNPGQSLGSLAGLRDGQRTADDRPLAGVLLELRDGLTGAPVSADRVLSGLPASGVVTVVTDARGYYEFRGLRPGVYAVYEVHPTGFVDGIDTPGTTGGIALNEQVPHGTEVATGLVKDPAGDAIVQIPVRPGQTSQENNFSEVLVERTGFQPVPALPERLPWTPPGVVVPPPLPWVATAIDVPRQVTSIPVYGSGGVTRMAWHLSVVNGGSPRSDLRDQDLSHGRWRTVSLMNRTQWVSLAAHHGSWTMVSAQEPDFSGVDGITLGMPGAIPISGDFNGDGVSEVGLFHEGQWFVDLNGNGRWDEDDLWAELGTRGDLPVVGDWDGDGKDDIGIFGAEWRGDERAIDAEPGLPDRQNELRLTQRDSVVKPKNLPPEPAEATDGRRVLQRTAGGTPREDLIDHVFRYGIGGDLPIAGDWNGDGISTIAVFRSGMWFLDTDGDGRLTDRDTIVTFGTVGDLPAVGDWNGDGIEDLGVFREGTWLLDSNGNRQQDDDDRVFRLGDAADIPVVGDWDGNGRSDAAVYRDAG